MPNNIRFENFSMENCLTELLKIKYCVPVFFEDSTNHKRPYAVKIMGYTFFYANDKTRQEDMDKLKELKSAMYEREKFSRHAGLVKIDADPYMECKMYKGTFDNIKGERFKFMFAISITGKTETKVITWEGDSPPDQKMIEEEIKKNNLIYFQR